MQAYADANATIAVEEDADYVFKTGPLFFKKKRCTRARIKSSLSRSFVHYLLYEMLMNYIVN